MFKKIRLQGIAIFSGLLLACMTVNVTAQNLGITYTGGADSVNFELNDQLQALDGSYYGVGTYRPDPYPNLWYLYFFKTDSSGSLIWEKVIKKPGYNLTAVNIALGLDGIYIGGNAGENPGWRSEGFVMRLTLQGTVLWMRQMDSVSFGGCRRVLAHPDGGCVWLGNINTANVIRMDSLGNELWHRSSSNFNYPNYAYNDLEIDSSGNIYVCGWAINGNASLGTLTKIDSLGIVLWVKNYGVNGRKISFESSVLVDGTLYIVGSSVIGSFEYLLLAKFDDNGNCLSMSTLDSQQYHAINVTSFQSASIVVVGNCGGWLAEKGFIAEFDNSLNFLRGLYNPNWFELTDCEVSLGGKISVTGWNDIIYATYNRSYSDWSWSFGCGFISLSDSTKMLTPYSGTFSSNNGPLFFTSVLPIDSIVNLTITECVNSVWISEISETRAVQLFPNPTLGTTSIDMSKMSARPNSFSISNYTGQLIFQERIAGQSHILEINLSEYGPGIYQLTFDTGETGKICVLEP